MIYSIVSFKYYFILVSNKDATTYNERTERVGSLCSCNFNISIEKSSYCNVKYIQKIYAKTY